jgi:hypothetical protein
MTTLSAWMQVSVFHRRLVTPSASSPTKTQTFKERSRLLPIAPLERKACVTKPRFVTKRIRDNSAKRDQTQINFARISLGSFPLFEERLCEINAELPKSAISESLSSSEKEERKKR